MPQSAKWRSRQLIAACAVVLSGLTAAFAIAAGVTSDQPSADAHRTLPREPTRKEGPLLHTAQQILFRDCMRREGFIYSLADENPVPEARYFAYVTDDVAWARAHGYGTDIQRKISLLRQEDPNQRYFESLPKGRRSASLKAAHGERMDLTITTPDGLKMTRSRDGCQSESERALYGDLATWFRARSTVDGLESMSQQRVLSDPGLTAKNRAWAACMRLAGHAYTSPSDLRAKLPPADKPLPRAEEIRLAVTEATCAHSSGLAATAAALERKYDTQLRQRYRSSVATERRLRLTALPRARSIVDAIDTAGTAS
jgi:hypothetical protein